VDYYSQDDQKGDLKMADDETLSTYGRSKAEGEIGFYKELFRLFDVRRQGCLPAIVKKFDKEKRLVTVVPLVKKIRSTNDGFKSSLRPEYTVPLFFHCAGGFSIDSPIFEGDTGMLFAVDREWGTARSKNSALLSSSQEEVIESKDGNAGPQAPDSFGMASFEYGFFLPTNFAPQKPNKDGNIEISAIKKEGESEEDTLKSIIIGKDAVKISFGGDTYEISKDGLKYSGKIDEEFSVLTDSKYDKDTHQLQKKSRPMKKRGTFIVDVGKESDWQMIAGGQAEPIPEETT
jgi:hypothetical protein